MAFYTDKDIFKYLQELQVIDASKLNQAFKLSQSQKRDLSDILLEKDLISNQDLGKVLSELSKMPLVYLADKVIPDDVLSVIPEIVAKKQKIIAFKKDKSGLHLAMVNPSDLQIKDFIAKKTGLPVVVYQTTKRDLKDALSGYTKDVASTFQKIIEENVEKAKGATQTDPPIIKIVDTIITFANQNKASDIHIEPLRNHSLVRFRVDGILHDVVKLPIKLHPQIITRIKVLSKLRTDEHQAAQDGKLVFNIDDEELDLRVSIVPITDGEKIVMRLLSESSRQFALKDLGLVGQDLIKTQQAQKNPHGMILSTGPTGSGKTTTLYSILKTLNSRDVNIATIEDPVEYDIEGVNQIQVNKKTGLTFAKGLRSIVRQDPDIILVGEIRDKITASIAVNSAMTGHLVLSTLHTNDAATTIPRLLDMGIEPFLVASTINVIIAQRLVRKTHQSCRVSVSVEIDNIIKQIGKENTVKAFGDKKRVRLYKGQGCEVDHGSGYSGRIGLFEVLVVDDEIRQAIVEKKDASVIRQIATKNGMTTMLDDGIKKVKQGLTTIEEVIRVTKE